MLTTKFLLFPLTRWCAVLAAILVRILHKRAPNIRLTNTVRTARLRTDLPNFLPSFPSRTWRVLRSPETVRMHCFFFLSSLCRHEVPQVTLGSSDPGMVHNPSHHVISQAQGAVPPSTHKSCRSFGAVLKSRRSSFPILHLHVERNFLPFPPISRVHGLGSQIVEVARVAVNLFDSRVLELGITALSSPQLAALTRAAVFWFSLPHKPHIARLAASTPPVSPTSALPLWPNMGGGSLRWLTRWAWPVHILSCMPTHQAGPRRQNETASPPPRTPPSHHPSSSPAYIPPTFAPRD